MARPGVPQCDSLSLNHDAARAALGTARRELCPAPAGAARHGTATVVGL